MKLLTLPLNKGIPNSELVLILMRFEGPMMKKKKEKRNDRTSPLKKGVRSGPARKGVRKIAVGAGG